MQDIIYFISFQVVIGGLCIILQIAALSINAHAANSGAGIWCGIMVSDNVALNHSFELKNLRNFNKYLDTVLPSNFNCIPV